VTPPPPPASIAPAVIHSIAAQPRYGFDNTFLGMSLDAWRARHPNAAACAAQAAGRILTCLADPTPIGGGFLARRLTYQFLDRQLVQISFQTSINAFSDTTAMVQRAYGPPTKIVRDLVKIEDHAVFPHVLMTWRNGRSTIRLSDPVSPGVTLSMRYRLDAADSKILDTVSPTM
jgi:hypothetical protein